MGTDCSSHKGSGLPPFLAKTYDMVDDPSSDDIVSWSSMGSSFIIQNPTDFSRDLLPKYFKHNNFSSFVRQLNTYGFRKICPDQWEFATEGFSKGKREAMKIIRRRKPLASSNSTCQAQDDVEHQQSQAEVPKCTISAHQELEEKVNRLEQEKKQLLDQLTKLQHEQQATETNLVDLGDRLKAMEERQQQMLSFFARFVNSSFWAQFAQRPPEINSLLVFNKKRRLIAGAEVLVGTQHQQGVPAGTRDSGDDSENIVGRALDVSDDGFSRQLSLCPPSDQPLGSSSISSDVCLKEAHAPAECMDSGKCLDASREYQRVLIGLAHSHHDFAQMGESGGDDADFLGGGTAADKQALDTLWNNTKMALGADKPYDGVISLRPPSNQSLGTSPISLSSTTFTREVQTPVECLETTVAEVCHGQTSEATIHSRCTRRQTDEVCYKQANEAMYSRCTRRLGDDSVALSKHLRDRLRTVVSSAPKSLGGKVSERMADESGSNDGFWEKYLTESPCSTDTEPDSDSDGVDDGANPRERQFL